MKKMNLPNKLTLFRLILFIPLLALFISYITLTKIQANFQANFYNITGRILLGSMLFIFALAMITDYFDGMIARKNNLVTDFGKLWDPIADKMIVNSTLIFLAVANFSPIWLVILFLARDLIVDACRVVMAKNNISVAASIWGKLKTVFQSFGIIVVFVIAISFNFPKELVDTYDYSYWAAIGFIHIINIPLILALGFSIASGILYLSSVEPYMQDK